MSFFHQLHLCFKIFASSLLRNNIHVPTVNNLFVPTKIQFLMIELITNVVWKICWDFLTEYNRMTLHKKCKVGTAQTLNLHWECKNSKVDTAQKMKFSIKDFFSKFDQFHSFFRIWPHLLKKSVIFLFPYFIYLFIYFYL